MTVKYKNANVFKPEYVNPKDKDLPIFVGERRMLIQSPKDSGKEVYDVLYDQFGTYMSKIPNSPAKNSVKKLYDRHLIFFGRDVTVPGKNGIVGSFIINKTKFAGVVLDSVELDINYETGETSNIDVCFYTSYFEFIRAVVTVYSNTIKQDLRLHSNLIKYLYFICLRIMGANVNFSNKHKEFLEVLCSYFFYRFLIGMQHGLAKETVYKTISKELQIEVDIFMPRLEKYTLMKDLFKGMIDFNLTQDPPAMLMMRALTKFKPTVFYSIVSSLDYLVAIAIVSKYPVSLFYSALISNNLQNVIEDTITPLINRISFDTVSVASL